MFNAVLCTTVVRNDMHTREHFLRLSVCLGLCLVSACWFRFRLLFSFSLDYFVLEFFAFVMAALRSRCGHHIFALWFLVSIYLFSSPNLSRRKLVSVILAHMVWL